MKQYDAFISHASEDKLFFVRPLFQKLREYGCDTWYDEFSLKPGMSLSRSIEMGLTKSKFGVVVLSKSFFKKNWTEFELRALYSFEVKNPGVIIPIWLEVTLEEVLEFSPYLADKLSIIADKTNISEAAIKLLEVIREDIFENVQRRKAWEEMVANAKPFNITEEIKEKIKFGPIRHENLSLKLIIRIRIIRAALLEVYPDTFYSWLDGFKRDMHPEDEIHIWEKIVAIYLEYFSYKKTTNILIQKEIFIFILGVFNGLENDNINSEFLSIEEKKLLRECCEFPFPKFDFN